MKIHEQNYVLIFLKNIGANVLRWGAPVPHPLTNTGGSNLEAGHDLIVRNIIHILAPQDLDVAFIGYIFI